MTVPQAPDVELMLTGLFRESLPAYVYIGRVVPEDTRDYMVTVRRQGGPTGRFLDRPRIGINVWAPTAEAANEFYGVISALLHEYTTDAENPIKSAAVYGLTEIREPTRLNQRYFTADLSVRTT